MAAVMDVLRWLQSPELVVAFQSYFGVEHGTQQPTADRFSKSGCDDDDDGDGGEYCGDTTTSSDCSDGSKSLYRRVLGSQMVGGAEMGTAQQQQTHRIHSWFWYYVFSIASLTGDEGFYTLFFPFWLWNVDGAVMRRVIVFWMVTMYIGQALKDLLKVPRPAAPPVARLDSKWVLEYGLPSTHAAVSLALPAALLLFSCDRYELSWPAYSVLMAVWCVTVSASRIYLGMHSLLDILCGQLLALVLLAALVPVMDVLDDAVLSHPISPLVVLGLTVAMVAAYPATATWNPARGDTAVILGVGCGTLMGAWLNYQVGVISALPHLSSLAAGAAPPRYPILWPSLAMVALAVLRTLLGLVLLLLLRSGVRSVAMRALCAVMQVDTQDYLHHNSKNSTSRGRLSRVQHCFIECGYKLITYICIGVLIATLAPAMFRVLGIERSTFSTEV